MITKLKNIYYSYALYDLPSDLWLAFRTKEMKAFIKNKFNCTSEMASKR